MDEDDREKDFADVLEKALDPAIEMCERMGEMRRAGAGPGSGANASTNNPSAQAGQGAGEEGSSKNLHAYSQGDWERDIFMINCLGYLQVSGSD